MRGVQYTLVWAWSRLQDEGTDNDNLSSPQLSASKPLLVSAILESEAML